jgi:hypothetical protein
MSLEARQDHLRSRRFRKKRIPVFAQETTQAMLEGDCPELSYPERLQSGVWTSYFPNPQIGYPRLEACQTFMMEGTRTILGDVA